MSQRNVQKGGGKSKSCCVFTNNKENVALEMQTQRKPSILKMKDEWITHSTVEVIQQILKRNTKKIQNFINSLGVPSWYRGLSIFQKKSAELLQNAIRDDRAQRTVYRTMRCLDSLGLDPMPTKKQLQVILAMSNGSDLALLWFLMEWLYQDSESDTYNVNEQLIMSSIAHLDMNITLQELDRILPPGQATKRDLARKSENEKKLPIKGKHDSGLRMKNVLPYFDKLPQPKSRRSEYLATEKERKAILDSYQYEFNEPLTAIENENRRWFQSYENVNKNDSSHEVNANIADAVAKVQSCHSHQEKSLSSSDTHSCCLIHHTSSNNLFFKETSKTELFKVCQGILPYKFNYREIFNLKHKTNENDDNEEHKSLYTETPGSNFTVVNSCLEPTFGCGDQINNSMQQTCHHEELQSQEKIETETQTDKVDYGFDYYDPDDDELMDRMLKDAFDIMKRDQKFVFASIPAAHRFPMLREWIRLRFGKTYTRNELTKSFQESQPIFGALIKIGLPVELPSNADIGENLITDYSCRDYVLRKSKHIRNEYYKRINRALLAQSRIIYIAMRPFLCCNGPPNNTIFAYTPAHKRECYHFRPWKLEECMRHKQVNYLPQAKSGNKSTSRNKHHA